MIPNLAGYLEHSPILLRVKMLRPVVEKIIDTFSKASLPFDVKEIVELARATDLSDPIVMTVSFILTTLTISVSPYIIPLLASPRQTTLALHFRWGAR